MTTKKLSVGTIHNKMPADLGKALLEDAGAVTVWESLTPLARNEWICWVENAKLIETRKRRIARVAPELVEGKRRPCCWIGCIHRTDKAISPSVQWVLDREKSKKQTA